MHLRLPPPDPRVPRCRLRQWYKNLLKTPAIRLAADGAEYAATARPVTDQGTVRQVLVKFSAKYGAGAVSEYYPYQDVAVEVALQ